MTDWAVVCLCAASGVQLFVSAVNGWPIGHVMRRGIIGSC